MGLWSQANQRGTEIGRWCSWQGTLANNTASMFGESVIFVTLVAGDAADAEDATQEALTMAWASWHTLRTPGTTQGWFWRILVNCCRSRAFRIRRGGEPAVAVYERPDDGVAFQRTYFVSRNSATLVARAGATSMS